MAASVRVECYAGYRADQEPRTVQWSGRRLRVLGIAKRWHEPDASCFRVRLEDGNLYELRRRVDDDAWSLVEVRRADG
ncbi:MAG: hypothetical protein JRI23_26650 [Deltaproteobacteria bacterium]|jgi:hypothetical protein|nr:hypothetical protein [Deltaproteobacteria bacterium]MBW2535626.1 hypothetical protein [Deltaproteobacteria bacterium]